MADHKDKKEADSKRFERHPSAYESGGFHITDKEGLKAQRGIVWDFLKQVGRNIMSGSNVMATAFPVHVNQPRSYLQCICDGWVYAPALLTKAGQSSDPVERMRLVIVWLLAGFHQLCALGKPFNPILGETYQATFPDGSFIYVEQSSHHPPITAWEVHGPKDIYKIYGYGEWGASFGGNSVKGYQKGQMTVAFADGQKITFSLPVALVHGVLWGDRVMEYEGQLAFKDEKNKLLGEVFIPPPSNSGFFGGLFGGKKLPTDYVVGDIHHEKKKVSHLYGTWLGSLEWDGKHYWSYKDAPTPHTPLADDKCLQSDSRFREDIVLLLKGDAKGAAEAKVRLRRSSGTTPSCGARPPARRAPRARPRSPTVLSRTESLPC